MFLILAKPRRSQSFVLSVNLIPSDCPNALGQSDGIKLTDNTKDWERLGLAKIKNMVADAEIYVPDPIIDVTEGLPASSEVEAPVSSAEDSVASSEATVASSAQEAPTSSATESPVASSAESQVTTAPSESTTEA